MLLSLTGATQGCHDPSDTCCPDGSFCQGLHSCCLNGSTGCGEGKRLLLYFDPLTPSQGAVLRVFRAAIIHAAQVQPTSVTLVVERRHA